MGVSRRSRGKLKRQQPSEPERRTVAPVRNERMRHRRKLPAPWQSVISERDPAVARRLGVPVVQGQGRGDERDAV